MVDAPLRGAPPALINRDILGEGCPVRRVLRLVGDKWTPLVLYCLSSGVWRFSDLQHYIPDISKKMLVQVLRGLEANGLVARTVYPVVPPKTEYQLTDTGRRLHEPMAMLCHWADQNTALPQEIETHSKPRSDS